MTTDIRNYVSNLLAGEKIISDFYYAAEKARSGYNSGRKFYYRFEIDGVGCDLFDNYCLTSLDTKAFCNSLEKIVSTINPSDFNIKDYATLLLFGQENIRSLYQAENKAIFARSNNKIFRYTFRNPFGNLSELNQEEITFTNANEFLYFSCESKKQTFDPLLLFPGII